MLDSLEQRWSEYERWKTRSNYSPRAGNPGGNDTSGSGGGIANMGIMLTVDNCIISHNHLGRNAGVPETWGAGIYSQGNLTVNNSTISNNQTNPEANKDDGGGIAVYKPGGSTAVFVLRNSTVRDNTAAQVAGGLFIYLIKSATIINSTIADNTSHTTGGGGAYIATTDGVTFSFATVSGFAGLFTMSGAAFGPTIAAVIYDAAQSYRAAFTIFAALSMAAIAVIYFARPPD